MGIEEERNHRKTFSELIRSVGLTSRRNICTHLLPFNMDLEVSQSQKTSSLSAWGTLTSLPLSLQLHNCFFSGLPATTSLFSEPQTIILMWNAKHSWEITIFNWNHWKPNLLFWEIPVLCNTSDKGKNASKVYCSLDRSFVSGSSRSGQDLIQWFT